MSNPSSCLRTIRKATELSCEGYNLEMLVHSLPTIFLVVLGEAVAKVAIAGSGDFFEVEFLFKERQSNEYLGGAELASGDLVISLVEPWFKG